METEHKEQMRSIINQTGLPKIQVNAYGVVRDKFGNIKGTIPNKIIDSLTQTKEA